MIKSDKAAILGAVVFGGLVILMIIQIISTHEIAKECIKAQKNPVVSNGTFKECK